MQVARDRGPAVGHEPDLDAHPLGRTVAPDDVDAVAAAVTGRDERLHGYGEHVASGLPAATTCTDADSGTSWSPASNETVTTVSVLPSADFSVSTSTTFPSAGSPPFTRTCTVVPTAKRIASAWDTVALTTRFVLVTCRTSPPAG